MGQHADVDGSKSHVRSGCSTLGMLKIYNFVHVPHRIYPENLIQIRPRSYKSVLIPSRLVGGDKNAENLQFEVLCSSAIQERRGVAAAWPCMSSVTSLTASVATAAAAAAATRRCGFSTPGCCSLPLHGWWDSVSVWISIRYYVTLSPSLGSINGREAFTACSDSDFRTFSLLQFAKIEKKRQLRILERIQRHYCVVKVVFHFLPQR